MGRKKQPTHDGLIRLVAERAAAEGADEASCPYIYDLRARKIWLAAFRAAKKGKLNGKNNPANRASKLAPGGIQRFNIASRAHRGSRKVKEWPDSDDGGSDLGESEI